MYVYQYWIREIGLVTTAYNKAVPSVINVNQTTKDRKNPSLLLTKLLNILLNNFKMLVYTLFNFCSLFRKCS